MLKEGVQRIFFHEGSGPNGVFDFGKYEGQTFAAVYMKDRSYAEWTLKQDKCRTWKLKCFKFFLWSLSDLERVLKREWEPEEMAQEEMRVLEEHRVRWADMDEDSEMERMVAIEEQEEQREAVQCGELEMAEERQWRTQGGSGRGIGGDGGAGT